MGDDSKMLNSRGADCSVLFPLEAAANNRSTFLSARVAAGGCCRAVIHHVFSTV